VPVRIFAAGTFGATSNSVVALLARYSLPSDPEVIQNCINAVRDVNERGDEMDDVKIDCALSEEERKDKMTGLGYRISADKIGLALELKQSRKLVVDTLNTMIPGLNPSFFDELYSSVPPPRGHIERQ